MDDLEPGTEPLPWDLAMEYMTVHTREELDKVWKQLERITSNSNISDSEIENYFL